MFSGNRRVMAGYQSDDAIDNELHLLRDKLRNIKRQRALLRLRTEIVREQKLLAREQQHLDEVTRLPNRLPAPNYTRPPSLPDYTSDDGSA